jgi:hypothetical protein
MSYVQRTLPTNLAATVTEDVDVDNSVTEAVTGSTSIFAVYLDNTAGSADAYLRIWDVVSGSVVNGTTDPTFIFYAPGNSARMYSIPAGLALSAALTYCGSSTGGTAGTTGPTNTLVARILTT